MKICPRCQRSARISERIETDVKKGKHWLIIFCAHCGFNYDIEEYTDKVLSPEDEMKKFDIKRSWPHA